MELAPFSILLWVKSRGIPFQFTERFIIGSSPLADVIIPDDDYVSSCHARLHREGMFWYADDRGAVNGTILDGRRIYAPALVHKGVELLVGHTPILLVPTTPLEAYQKLAQRIASA